MTRLPENDLQEIARTEGIRWETLRGNRILLTGGTGFFGQWLIESFVQANRQLALNATMVVLSREPDAFLKKHPHLNGVECLEWAKGDVRSFEFPAGEFTHVIHAATPVITIKSPQDAHEILSIIVEGTSHVLAFCKAKRVRRLLLISSGAIYGAQPMTLPAFSEDWNGAPNPALIAAAYGEGKRAAETMCVCAAASYGFEARIARCFAFVGPGLPLDTHFAAGNFIRDILNGTPPQLKGDPNTVRSYLYVSDLAAWLWSHLTGEGHAVINVGSDEAVTLGNLANDLSMRHLGKTAVATSNLGTPGNRYVPDISRARENGCRITVNLAEAFDKTIAFHKGTRS